MSRKYFFFSLFIVDNSIFQKQPPRCVLRKRYSENIQQIFRRAPTSKCNFNKVSLQLCWNHTSAWCSPVNLLHISRTPFLKNISEGLFPIFTYFKKLIDVKLFNDLCFFTWLSFSEFRFSDVSNLILCCRQLNFFKTTNEVSAKTFNPL